MNSIAIRPVERFVEPDFTRLQRQVFADFQQSSPELASTLDHEVASTGTMAHTHSPMHRIGAYVGENLIGWSYGWMERSNVFYMANSGVILSHRRKGVYTSLLKTIREHATSMAAVAIRSQHSVLNNPVIIAKLQAGFNITGLSHSAHMGTLVELTLHFSTQRQDLYRSRSLPYVVPDAY